MEMSKEIVQQRGGKRDTVGEWGRQERAPSWQGLGLGLGCGPAGRLLAQGVSSCVVMRPG